MKISRKEFIKNSLLMGGAILTNNLKAADSPFYKEKKEFPLVISTWAHGLPASNKAMEVLSSGGNLLDAVTKGINIIENDPDNHSVGIGGYPDAEGNVTLDASIMDCKGNAGSVAYLQNIKNPINVARMVMEKSKHVLLVGKGAQNFAIKNGFKVENLLTAEMKKKWEKWNSEKKEEMIDPVLGSDKNHDTIGLLAIDTAGNISGGVSTSGWAYKLPGRVGDSPIIGAGMFVDNEVGAACATGLGEHVIKSVGSFLIVELMRHGYTPLDAIKTAVKRLQKKGSGDKFQVAYIALNKNGEYAGYALRTGFEFAAVTNNYAKMIKTDSLIK
jgi:isoaspartyl peptidase/L-asparaginase-like protein (Ntn-hydrolase superfamily)